ncbi:MAG: hypothetical protein QOI22_1004 [Verrucomicrobiota bacterium]
MKTLLPTLLALFLAAQLVTAGNAIEFSADTTEFTGEGVVYRRLTFKEDKQTISYLPPQGWNCTLIGKNLHLRPVDKNFAAAEIEAISLPAPAPFNDETIAALSEQVVNAAPPGSGSPTLLKQERNPVLLNNNQSFEVLASYRLLGDTFQRSVLFVNTPTNQIVFKLTARKTDFDALYRAFRCSVLSWEWHEPTVATAGQ